MTTKDVSEKSPKYTRGMNPNSRKNLRSGYHGQNNGQNGYTLTSALKHRLAKDPALREKIIDSTIEGCILRETSPFREVWDRSEGKVPERTLPNTNTVITNFLFVLPDGTELSPKALIEGANGNNQRKED